ncbi:hypothetical protein [Actinomycetospora aeridis]|uniref:Uncharacterized protein n=1 Tax=Actinomycetospora aeridis TaxID=3129231 RepID=A0ABU8NBY7_9PSEU
MEWDAQAAGWLEDALARLRASGLAGLVERTVARVWEANVDRFDPVVAGDTATSLGITASENIRTLLLREDRHAWAERGVLLTSRQQALVLVVDGLEVLIMKAGALDWEGTRWDLASDVRRSAAEDNAKHYEPDVEHQSGQTWWPRLVSAADDRPEELRHLVLVWTGDPVTAVTSGWLGVPYAGPAGSTPWLAVTPVWRHGADDVPRPPEPLIAVPRARPPSDPVLRSRA